MRLLLHFTSIMRALLLAALLTAASCTDSSLSPALTPQQQAVLDDKLSYLRRALAPLPLFTHPLLAKPRPGCPPGITRLTRPPVPGRSANCNLSDDFLSRRALRGWPRGAHAQPRRHDMTQQRARSPPPHRAPPPPPQLGGQLDRRARRKLKLLAQAAPGGACGILAVDSRRPRLAGFTPAPPTPPPALRCRSSRR